MIPRPMDDLYEAVLALEGVCDLLVHIEGRDLHHVSPDALYHTLSLPVRQARRAYDQMAETPA